MESNAGSFQDRKKARSAATAAAGTTSAATSAATSSATASAAATAATTTASAATTTPSVIVTGGGAAVATIGDLVGPRRLSTAGAPCSSADLAGRGGASDRIRTGDIQIHNLAL
jgi:hypothetical protein